MANPTQAQLITLYTTMIEDNTPSSGECTDDQINDVLKGSIDVVDNLDPDRPVKVRNLNRI